MFFKKLLAHKAFLRAFRIINSLSTLVLNLQLSILESSILQKSSAIVQCRQSSNNFSYCCFTTDVKRKILNHLKSVHPAMKKREMISTYKQPFGAVYSEAGMSY